MSIVKPLKIGDNGKLIQISNQDQLPNDAIIDNHTLLLRKLLFELYNQGFKFNDQDLLNELIQYQ